MQAADHRLAPLPSRQESKQLVRRHFAISADGHEHKQLRDYACVSNIGIEGMIPSQECCNCCLSSAYQPRAVYLLLTNQEFREYVIANSDLGWTQFQKYKIRLCNTSGWLESRKPQEGQRELSGCSLHWGWPKRGKRYLKMLPFHRIQEKSKGRVNGEITVNIRLDLDLLKRKSKTWHNIGT